MHGMQRRWDGNRCDSAAQVQCSAASLISPLDLFSHAKHAATSTRTLTLAHRHWRAHPRPSVAGDRSVSNRPPSFWRPKRRFPLPHRSTHWLCANDRRRIDATETRSQISSPIAGHGHVALRLAPTHSTQISKRASDRAEHFEFPTECTHSWRVSWARDRLSDRPASGAASSPSPLGRPTPPPARRSRSSRDGRMFQQ